jgi:hypothetical protein
MYAKLIIIPRLCRFKPFLCIYLEIMFCWLLVVGVVVVFLVMMVVVCALSLEEQPNKL